MKAPINLHLLLISCCMIICFACGKKNQTRQYTIDLMFADGTHETHQLVNGNMLYIHQGDQQYIVQVADGSDSTMMLEVTNYGVTRDSMRNEQTIRKTGSSKSSLSLKRQTQLDPSGGVQVTVSSMAMIDTGRQPRGACKGKCCEATCFTMSCCSDPDECKNAPCNCTAPGPCPGQNPSPQASHFFELFKSGKELLVVKD